MARLCKNKDDFLFRRTSLTLVTTYLAIMVSSIGSYESSTSTMRWTWRTNCVSNSRRPPSGRSRFTYPASRYTKRAVSIGLPWAVGTFDPLRVRLSRWNHLNPYKVIMNITTSLEISDAELKLPPLHQESYKILFVLFVISFSQVISELIRCNTSHYCPSLEWPLPYQWLVELLPKGHEAYCTIFWSRP